MKNRSTMSRTGQTVYYGAVFEVKKEIPVVSGTVQLGDATGLDTEKEHELAHADAAVDLRARGM